MKKLYFSELDELRCLTLKDILKEMEKLNIDELKVFEAKPVRGESYFYCTKFQDIGEIGETCGEFCEYYNPRNVKSGICRYYRNCYEPTEKFRILKLKK